MSVLSLVFISGAGHMCAAFFITLMLGLVKTGTTGLLPLCLFFVGLQWSLLKDLHLFVFKTRILFEAVISANKGRLNKGIMHLPSYALSLVACIHSLPMSCGYNFEV